MIIIGGIDIDVDSLPAQDLLGYEVVTDPEILEIKLKTRLRSRSCLGAFIVKEWDSIPVAPELMSKVQYFETEQELRALLEQGVIPQDEESSQQPVEEERTLMPTVQEEETSSSISTSTTVPNPLERLNLETPKLVIGDVEITLPSIAVEAVEELQVSEEGDDSFQLPGLEDIQNLQGEELTNFISTKDMIIREKNKRIEEMERVINEMYETQEALLLELHNTHKEQIAKANSVIQTLRDQLSQLSISPDIAEFAKYSSYASVPLAISKAEFSEADQVKLASLRSTVHVIASAVGGATYRYLMEVVRRIRGGSQAVILDFTGDTFLRTSLLKNKALKTYAFHLGKEDRPIGEAFFAVNKSFISFSRSYNDLSLLVTDWVDLLQKVDAQAEGNPIILLFNCMNSFAVRYTVSKLSTIAANKTAHIFTLSSPFELVATHNEISLIPSNRVFLVALDYKSAVDEFFKLFQGKYKVHLIPDEVKEVNWGKIGIKL